MALGSLIGADSSVFVHLGLVFVPLKPFIRPGCGLHGSARENETDAYIRVHQLPALGFLYLTADFPFFLLLQLVRIGPFFVFCLPVVVKPQKLYLLSQKFSRGSEKLTVQNLRSAVF